MNNDLTTTMDRVETVTVAPSQARRQAVSRRYRVKPGSAAEGALVEQYLPLVKTVGGKVAMTLLASRPVVPIVKSSIVVASPSRSSSSRMARAAAFLHGQRR